MHLRVTDPSGATSDAGLLLPTGPIRADAALEPHGGRRGAAAAGELRQLRELVEGVRGANGASLRRACRLAQISRTLHAYSSRTLSREGLRRRMRQAVSRAHERRSMDFVHNALIDGRALRVLTVVDQRSRWSSILEVAKSMSGEAVAAALDRAIAQHCKPRSITVDHAAEFTSRAFDEWAHRRAVALDFIKPGKPVENGFIESFNLYCAAQVDLPYIPLLKNRFRRWCKSLASRYWRTPLIRSARRATARRSETAIGRISRCSAFTR